MLVRYYGFSQVKNGFILKIMNTHFVFWLVDFLSQHSIETIMFVCLRTCNSFEYPFSSGDRSHLKRHGIQFPQFDMLQTTLSASTLVLCALLLIKKKRTKSTRQRHTQTKKRNSLQFVRSIFSTLHFFRRLFSVIYHERAYTRSTWWLVSSLQ